MAITYLTKAKNRVRSCWTKLHDSVERFRAREWLPRDEGSF